MVDGAARPLARARAIVHRGFLFGLADEQWAEAARDQLTPLRGRLAVGGISSSVRISRPMLFTTTRRAPREIAWALIVFTKRSARRLM